MVRAVISNPTESSVRSSTRTPSGPDAIDGFEIGIVLPSGYNAVQTPESLVSTESADEPLLDAD